MLALFYTLFSIITTIRVYIVKATSSNINNYDNIKGFTPTTIANTETITARLHRTTAAEAINHNK